MEREKKGRKLSIGIACAVVIMRLLWQRRHLSIRRILEAKG